jgi:PBP1b-binding outer membrane lipoprotein LpoB
MKFTKLILLFVLTIAAVGCSSDDDNNDTYDYNKDNLTGTYKLTYFQTKEVETVNVNGFDVVTTTTAVGDTFNFNVVFATNNTVTADGTYRITETIVQGSQSNTDTYIIDVDNEVTGYSVNAATAELTLDGDTYKVSNFSPTGFTITLAETFVEPNGDSSVFNSELRFSKQ